MNDFRLPDDITYNHGAVTDPAGLVESPGARAWLFLCGDEFAAMEGGVSYDDVVAVVESSAKVVSDPPRVLDRDIARQQVAALDDPPRPVLITCRTGPRASAVAYLYAGLPAGAGGDEVLARADADGALFTAVDDYKAFVVDSLAHLADDSSHGDQSR